MSKMMDRMAGWSTVIACVFWTGSLLLVLGEVVARRLFNGTLGPTFELVQYWGMVGIVYFALTGAFQRKENLEAPIVYDTLGQRARRELDIFSALLTIVFLGGLVFYGALEAFDGMELGATAGLSEVPAWPMYFAVPIAAAGCLLVVAHQFLTAVQQRFGKGRQE